MIKKNQIPAKVSSCSHYHVLKTVNGAPRLNVVIPVRGTWATGQDSLSHARDSEERFWSILQIIVIFRNKQSPRVLRFMQNACVYSDYCWTCQLLMKQWGVVLLCAINLCTQKYCLSDIWTKYTCSGNLRVETGTALVGVQSEETDGDVAQWISWREPSAGWR